MLREIYRYAYNAFIRVRVPAAKVCSTYPSLEESGAIDDILPKKEQAILAKLWVSSLFLLNDIVCHGRQRSTYYVLYVLIAGLTEYKLSALMENRFSLHKEKTTGSPRSDCCINTQT